VVSEDAESDSDELEDAIGFHPSAAKDKKGKKKI
jgi:hypothetical protein